MKDLLRPKYIFYVLLALGSFIFGIFQETPKSPFARQQSSVGQSDKTPTSTPAP